MASATSDFATILYRVENGHTAVITLNRPEVLNASNDLMRTELGEAWAGGKLSGVLKVDLNGQPFGRADAGEDMTFDFGTLVAHLAKTRNLCAGTIVGSGTVSNRDADGGPGKPVDRGGRGYSCLAEVRTVETILDGAAATPFLKAGDRVRIWMEDAAGHSIFGAIEQEVVAG